MTAGHKLSERATSYSNNGHKMIPNANVSSDTLHYGGLNCNKISPQEKCEIAGVSVGPRQVTITIHVLTLLVSLTGNILLMVTFVRMKKNITILIANMAASDLLVAIFLIPRLITREITGSNAFLVHGIGGILLCKMCTFLSDMSLSVSTQSMVFIAMERFLAVAHPFLYKKITVKTRRVFIALTWIMATVLHSPYFYTFRLVTRKAHNGTDNQYCETSWEPAFRDESAQFRYNIFLFATVLFLPLVAVSVLYVLLVIKLRRPDKMVTCLNENRARRKNERNRNLKKMVTATLTAFLICWTLYIVINFLRLISPATLPKCSKSFEIVDYISRVLASSYSCVNPCLCFIFLRIFSRELSALCKRSH